MTREYYMGDTDIVTITANIDFLTDGEDETTIVDGLTWKGSKIIIKELFLKNDKDGSIHGTDYGTSFMNTNYICRTMLIQK